MTNRSIALGFLLAANLIRVMSYCLVQVSWVEREEKRVEDLANTSADSHLPAAQDELLKVSTFVSQLGKAHNKKTRWCENPPGKRYRLPPKKAMPQNGRCTFHFAASLSKR